MLSKIDAEKFNTLIEINSRINSNFTDLHSLLVQILDSASSLCHSEASILLLINREAGELYFEAVTGSKEKETEKHTVKLNEGIAGWVVTNNKSIIVNDVEKDNRYSNKLSGWIGYAIKAILAVPMRIKDECIGVIELVNKKDQTHFIQDDLEWLEIFANQAALAVRNAQNFQKVEGEISQLQKELIRNKGYHTLVAKSPKILEKLEIVQKVAQTDSSVLILGESGVGKELFAERIHFLSARSAAPFVRVNCAALPEGILESELFGHVKGAFTNAFQNRQGRFELANGGTMFLDEIGDMPLSLQSKILRVLQQKTFEKVGADTSITVDVRILAATNRDIESMVEKGEFRSDLYYRINVLPIYIPPLRQRPEDIPELADFFLKKYQAETKKQFTGFSAEAMEYMLSYSWPGNVRELENSIERACVIGKEGDPIKKEYLFLRIAPEPAEPEGEGCRDLKNAVNSFKVQFIEKVLEENDWNQTEAAKELNIQRTYLSRLIKELSIKDKEC